MGTERGIAKKLQVLGKHIQIHMQSVAHAFKTVIPPCNCSGPELHGSLQMRKKSCVLIYAFRIVLYGTFSGLVNIWKNFCYITFIKTDKKTPPHS